MSSGWLNFFFTAFISLFAIVNPFGNAPLFLTFTEDKTEKERTQIAFRSSLASMIILLAFIFLGKYILLFFRITISDFQIAGGIIIFVVGLNMLQVRHPRTKSIPQEQEEAMEKEDISIVPLGIPILSGPGAIATAMVLAYQSGHLFGKVLVAIGAILTAGFTFFIFKESIRLIKFLGHTGINLLTRLMGLILMVKAVEFVVQGIYSAFPQLFSR